MMRHGILYSQKGSNECVGFSDTDWAGDIDNKSRSGYLFQINEGTATWKSKKQGCVALSTTETKHIALSSAAQESVCLRWLTSETGSPPRTPTTIFEDSQSVTAKTKNPHFHGCAKHINIKYHFIQEWVNCGNIKHSSTVLVRKWLLTCLLKVRVMNSFANFDKAGIMELQVEH